MTNDYSQLMTSIREDISKVQEIAGIYPELDEKIPQNMIGHRALNLAVAILISIGNCQALQNLLHSDADKDLDRVRRIFQGDEFRVTETIEAQEKNPETVALAAYQVVNELEDRLFQQTQVPRYEFSNLFLRILTKIREHNIKITRRSPPDIPSLHLDQT